MVPEGGKLVLDPDKSEGLGAVGVVAERSVDGDALVTTAIRPVVNVA
jgi:hypothetical protein